MKHIILTNKKKYLNLITILAMTTGIFLLLFSIQSYFNWKKLSKSEGEYIVLSKPVSILNTIGLSNAFSEEEIEELENISSVLDIGVFESSNYAVSVGSNRLGFSTQAFFESVPDRFMDVEYNNWDNPYKEGDIIPIVLSSDYLTLYNYGFAPSQGLPKFSPSTIGKITLDITLQGDKGYRFLKGKIVGFSNNLNSIIVPQSFMKWANNNLSTLSKSPSRVLLKTKNISTPTLNDFLIYKGYQTNTKKAFGQGMSKVVNRSVFFLFLFGFFILLLSFIVLYLYFRLNMEEKLEEINNLYIFGYSPSEINAVFQSSIIRFILLSIIPAIILLQIVHYFIAQFLNQVGFEMNYTLNIYTLTVGILLAGFLYFIYNRSISRFLQKKYL